jgi:uncharacterized membrane protein YccC
VSDYHTHDYANEYHQHDDKAEDDHRHLDLLREIDRLDQMLTRALQEIVTLSRRLVAVEQRNDQADPAEWTDDGPYPELGEAGKQP